MSLPPSDIQRPSFDWRLWTWRVAFPGFLVGVLLMLVGVVRAAYHVLVGP